MNEDDVAEDIDEAIRRYSESMMRSFGANDVTVLNYGSYLELEMSNGDKFKVEITKL